MIGGLLILAAAAFGGTVLTWLFDDRAPGYARVATGTTIGSFGCMGATLASVMIDSPHRR